MKLPMRCHQWFDVTADDGRVTRARAMTPGFDLRARSIGWLRSLDGNGCKRRNGKRLRDRVLCACKEVVGRYASALRIFEVKSTLAHAQRKRTPDQSRSPPHVFADFAVDRSLFDRLAFFVLLFSPAEAEAKLDAIVMSVQGEW